MSSRAIFSWARGVNGAAVSFFVKYKIGDGSFKTATTTDTSFEIDNLKPNSTVTFQVRSVGVAPKKAYSAAIDAVL